jgi:hypothetical protein
MAKSRTIPVPPTSLNWPPLGGRWFHWSEIEAWFRHGVNKKSRSIDPELAEIKDYGGVYLLAWSRKEPQRIRPHLAREVQYIGQTYWFKARLDGFRASAGFLGKRTFGHSAGWRWDKGKKANLWVAFFDVTEGLSLEAHVASALRCWVEAVALEEYRLVHGTLPAVNKAKPGKVVKLEG